MIGYFSRHPTAANLLMVVIILAGVLGISAMRREVFPEFDSDFVRVEVVYRGTSAEEIEETICQRIERELEGISGIEQVYSTAREGLGTLRVEVADGYEVQEVLADVENAVDQVDNFPERAEEPIVAEEERVDPVLTVTLSGSMADKDLLLLADDLRDELVAVDGVSQVEIQGFSEHQIRVELNEAALFSHGLTVGDVARAIDRQSTDLPAGSVENDEREIKVRVVDQRRWAEDFRDLIVVSSATGARIRLRDLGRVTDTFEDDWVRTTFNGKPAVHLQVNKAETEDIIRAARKVREYLAEYIPRLPQGVTATTWGDWSDPVHERLGMLFENGLLGFVLVFFTLWAFLRLRLAVWVALGIPISFMGALWLMDQANQTLNMITMFSLILALGIVADDAIVIGENIFAHRQRGKKPMQAAIDGTKEVAAGVVASMVTTVAIFLPLMMMTGEIGKNLRVMPFGVIAALAISLVESFFILPNHVGHSLKRERVESSGLRATIDRSVGWVTDHVYGRVLRWSLGHRAVTICTIVMLFLVCVGLLAGKRLRFQPFPELDGHILIARVLFPRGTSFTRTQEVVQRVEASLEQVNTRFKPLQPGQKDLVLRYSTRFGVNDEADEQGSHVAMTTVELLAADERNARCDDVLNEWRHTVGEVPDIVSLTFDQMQVTPGGKAIDIQLRGKNLEDLRRASLALQTKIRGYSGVRNLTDDLRPGKREVRLRLKEAARSLGITSQDLAGQVRAAFWGEIAEEFQRGRDTFEVRTRLRPSDRFNSTDIEDFKIVSHTGGQIPLRELANVEVNRGYSKITRVGSRRAVSVTADVDTSEGNAAEIMGDLKANFFAQFLENHPGVSVDLEGQEKETAKTAGSIRKGFIIGLVMIFVLLSFVFKSYIEPFIVMTSIPLGLIGAALGHLAMGLDWTIPSTLGLISLAGIIVNDSIVFVEFIKKRRREGMEVVDAILAAGKSRFRPVILTSATTVMGLLPMLAETSLQAQFLIPMATSIAFGLLFATVLTLLLVPCMYSLIGGYVGRNHDAE